MTSYGVLPGSRQGKVRPSRANQERSRLRNQGMCSISAGASSQGARAGCPTRLIKLPGMATCPVQGAGGNAPSFLCLVILVAIGSLQDGAMAMADPLYLAVVRGDIEGARAPDGNASEVGTHLLPSGHDCPHDVAPIWKPLTRLACLGPVRGKPKRSIRHICRDPCPVAAMSNGTAPRTSMHSGVLVPTQAASSQCVLGSPRCVRLYLVSPPEPHSTGKPNAWSLSYKAKLVAFTAAASLSGAFACESRRVSRSGLCLRNSRLSRAPFFVLQGSHARHKLLIRLLPPLARGIICST